MQFSFAARPTCTRASVAATASRRGTLLLALSVLWGCSGGGSDSSNGDVAQPPPAAAGKVTLNWTRPTTNEDGTTLTDLAGYHVYYGQSPGAWNSTLDVPAAAVSVEIQGLTSGAWYFAISTYNTAGIESSKSGVVSTNI